MSSLSRFKRVLISAAKEMCEDLRAVVNKKLKYNKSLDVLKALLEAVEEEHPRVTNRIKERLRNNI